MESRIYRKDNLIKAVNKGWNIICNNKHIKNIEIKNGYIEYDGWYWGWDHYKMTPDEFWKESRNMRDSFTIIIN